MYKVAVVVLCVFIRSLLEERMKLSDLLFCEWTVGHSVQHTIGDVRHDGKESSQICLKENTDILDPLDNMNEQFQCKK